MIIGVSGISCSGKSTVSEYLARAMSCKVISLDDYYHLERCAVTRVQIDGRDVGDWDNPHVIDWDSFIHDIKAEKSRPLIVEGFLLCFSEPIMDLIDRLITIEFSRDDYQIALKRRIYRGFHEDVPPDYMEDPFRTRVTYECRYFHDFVWKRGFDHPEYTHPPETWRKPVLVLKSTDPIEINNERSASFCLNLK